MPTLEFDKNNSKIANYFNQYFDAYYHISSGILDVCSEYFHNDCLDCPFKHTLFHEKYDCEFAKVSMFEIIVFRNFCEQIIEILEVHNAHT